MRGKGDTLKICIALIIRLTCERCTRNISLDFLFLPLFFLGHSSTCSSGTPTETKDANNSFENETLKKGILIQL